MTDKKSDNRHFNIYYLNLSKVYEIAMTINNTIVSSIERSSSYKTEKENGRNYGLGAQGSYEFLSNIKASFSSDIKTTTSSSSGVVERMEVKTTKSILLGGIIDRCSNTSSLAGMTEGELIKIDNVKLKLVDEEVLKQILLLRRDALKGLSVEGVEINNLVDSVLQDFAYILRGETTDGESFILKIPTDSQPEFESKYTINDLLIGHVSIIGIFKGKAPTNRIALNMLNTFKSTKRTDDNDENNRIIKSSTASELDTDSITNAKDSYYIDTIGIVQDVSFRCESIPEVKMRWWNKLGIWLSNLGRRK